MDNKNQSKKDRKEWTIMNLFMESFSQFPIGDVEKSERPDFIVTTRQGKRIGIELTELKYERKDTEFNMRAHEDFLSQIMLKAQEIFESKSKLTLVVDAHFADSIAPEIVQQPSCENAQLISNGLTEAIVRIIEDNLPEATGKHYIVDRNSKYGDINLPSMIESIHISNVTGRMEALWYASISTRVKPLTVDSIVQRIKDKDIKLRGYDKTCDQHWLLIIQNSFLMSSHYDPVAVQHALKHRYRTLFKRIFVFERSSATVSELNLIHRINSSH
ncbi:MAG: hypothetical protein MJZ13_07280 [Bacteroidales bacterium]|nr:hypothetical protein [Bacteroidales bacterium]